MSGSPGPGRPTAVPSDPAGFVRAGYPVAAVFLAVMCVAFGIAAVTAQATDPVRVDDVGSFALPAAGEGRALYVASDSLDLLGEPPCQARGRVLESGDVIALTRTLARQRTRIAGHVGSVEGGTRITCPSLAGTPGWLAQPAGQRWMMAGMALVLLVVLTLIRIVAVAVLGETPRRGPGPQGAAR